MHVLVHYLAQMWKLLPSLSFFHCRHSLTWSISLLSLCLYQGSFTDWCASCLSLKPPFTFYPLAPENTAVWSCSPCSAAVSPASIHASCTLASDHFSPSPPSVVPPFPPPPPIPPGSSVYRPLLCALLLAGCSSVFPVLQLTLPLEISLIASFVVNWAQSFRLP